LNGLKSEKDVFGNRAEGSFASHSKTYIQRNFTASKRHQET